MEKETIASHYQGDKGVDYATGRQDTLNHFGYQLQKKFFIPFLTKDMHVLDFGCGNGSIAKALESHVASIEGLEVNSYARSLAVTQNLTVYDSLNSLPKDKQFDAIISNHVLEHIPDVVNTLKVLSHHLTPEGVFVTVLPIEDFRARRNRQWDPNDPNHHLYTWTPLLFGNTLQEAGFEPKELKIITHAWTSKLFFLGDTWLQGLACWVLSVLMKKRQLLAVAVRANS